MEASIVDRIAPTARRERVVSLDVLRGFAVLGILVMNVQSFSMIMAAYNNPAAYGDLEGLNRWVWIGSHLFADLKFMAIFAMLFGAGIVLMSEHLTAKGRGAAGIHYRRTLILILFGATHAYLLWYGDILFWYGLCGLLVFLLRKLSPRWLLALGLVVLCIPSAMYALGGLSIPAMPPEALQALDMQWKPSSELIAQEVAAYRGNWQQQMDFRVPTALNFHIFYFFIWGLWRAGGLMLIGMALYKWGVLSATRSRRFYLIQAMLGLTVGWLVVGYGIVRNFEADWSLSYSMFFGVQFNYWASLAVSLGYIGVVMLICKTDWLRKLTVPFAAVGRTALTNYLIQTIIFTTLFYGHGFGWFGQLERVQQIGVMLAVWIVQLVISPLWLKYFRFGPFEWLWRSLTYWQLQPIRKTLSQLN